MARPPSPRVALGILTGVNLLNYVDRYMPSAVLPSIIAALHISDAEAGALQTLFIVTYMLMSPVAGWLGDRRPRFQLAALAVLLWSATTFGSGLAPTFLTLVLMRSLIGVGEAGYSVVTPSLLSDFYPPARRGRALSIFYAAIPVGTALGYVIGGQVDARLGWRWAFFVAGAPGAILALVLLVLRPPSRCGVRGPSSRRWCGGGAGSSTRPLRPSSRSRWAGSAPGCRPTSSASVLSASSRPRP